MAVTKEELVDALSNMKVLDVVELIKSLEDKWGVSAAAPVAVAAAGGGAAPAAAAEEQTEFNVTMSSFGANKVGVIKVIREITGLCLRRLRKVFRRLTQKRSRRSWLTQVRQRRSSEEFVSGRRRNAPSHMTALPSLSLKTDSDCGDSPSVAFRIGDVFVCVGDRFAVSRVPCDARARMPVPVLRG
jgi:large subunit ribosomal protein L7/L12